MERVRVGEKKSNTYIRQGVVIGGEVGRGFSLKDIRRIYSRSDSIERVIVEMGDFQGSTLKDNLGFFQVSKRSDIKRVDVHFSQTRLTQVSPSRLIKAFQGAHFINKPKLTHDPEDGSMTLQLFLTKDVEMEVFTLMGKDGVRRIAIDFKEL